MEESFVTSRPIIGITPGITPGIADADDRRYMLGRHYSRMVIEAGGTPIILPCEPDRLDSYLDLCDGFILSGGDDPDMTAFGEPMHPEAKPIDPQRQQFELGLLKLLDGRPEAPTLGICLGMQLMALHAGGRLDQHLPDTLATAAMHWDHGSHQVSGQLGSGIVHSHHRQAITDPGELSIVSRASDDVIEAVRQVDRAFYVGVQWHPERTDNQQLGIGLFQQLVEAAVCASAR